MNNLSTIASVFLLSLVSASSAESKSVGTEQGSIYEEVTNNTESLYLNVNLGAALNLGVENNDGKSLEGVDSPKFAGAVKGGWRFNFNGISVGIEVGDYFVNIGNIKVENAPEDAKTAQIATGGITLGYDLNESFCITGCVGAGKAEENILLQGCVNGQYVLFGAGALKVGASLAYFQKVAGNGVDFDANKVVPTSFWLVAGHLEARPLSFF